MEIIMFFIILYISFGAIKKFEGIKNIIDNDIDEKEFDNDEVIIYKGDTNVSELEKMLLNENIRYKIINDLLLDKNEENEDYKCIIALSDDDFSNIMICVNALRYYSISNAFSICNNIINETIYDKYNIETTNVKNTDYEKLILFIREKLEKWLSWTNIN